MVKRKDNKSVRQVPVRYLRPDGTEFMVPPKEERLSGAEQEASEMDEREVDGGEPDVSDRSEGLQPDTGPSSAEEVDYAERWKRAAADLDNYRKRFDRELDRQKGLERQTILRAWLEVVDNMERALCADGASNNPWYEGMEAIHQQMLSVLGQFGCTPVVPMGEQFDPHKHEAVAAANLLDEPEGKIVDVTLTGYEIDGVVLRAPKVIVVAHGSGGSKG